MNSMRFAYRLGFYDGRKAAINYITKYIKDECRNETDYNRLLNVLDTLNVNTDKLKFKFMDREEPDYEN